VCINSTRELEAATESRFQRGNAAGTTSAHAFVRPRHPKELAMLKRSLTALTLTALPSAAFAAAPAPLPEGSECASDNDCAEGFECEVTGGASCACAPGVDCDCAPIEYRTCVPGPCQSDADCDAGMVCATYDTPCAVSAPCDSDGFCPDPIPCEATKVSICAPRWVLPCEAAADCGDGFDCQPAEVCSCDGGAPTDPAEPVPPGEPAGGDSSGDVPGAPVPEGSCTCEPTGENYCVAKEVACDDDSTCPAGWSCEHFNATPPVDCAPASSGGSDPGSSDTPRVPPEDPSGEGAPLPCDAAPPAPEPTQGSCYPPYSVSFDSGIPRGGDGSAPPQYESGSATSATPQDPTSNTGGTPGQADNGTGCAGGGSAVPVVGLGLLMAAMWRRRSAVGQSVHQ